MPENNKDKESLLLRLLSVPILVLMGLVFAVAAFWPGLDETLDSWIGYRNIIYLGMGFLFFYTAVLVAEKNHMRQKFIGLLQEIQRFFYGADYEQISEAVAILINVLCQEDDKVKEKAAKQLRRLTGQDFGISHAEWNVWWKENRERFLRERQESSQAERRESHDSSE